MKDKLFLMRESLLNWNATARTFTNVHHDKAFKNKVLLDYIHDCIRDTFYSPACFEIILTVNDLINSRKLSYKSPFEEIDSYNIFKTYHYSALLVLYIELMNDNTTLEKALINIISSRPAMIDNGILKNVFYS